MPNLPIPIDPPPVSGEATRLRIYPPHDNRKSLPAPKPSLPAGIFATTIWFREAAYAQTIWTPEAWAKLPDTHRPADAKQIEGGAIMRLVPRP